MVYINEVPFGTEKYPNGETIYKSFKIDYTKNYIKVVYEDDSDITKMIFAKKCLDNSYGFKNMETILIIYYFPYSRMDRRIDGYLFSLKYICDIINSLNFSRVEIVDPHSIVTPALVDRCYCCYSVPVLITEDCDYLFYPDNGAVKKYTEVFKIYKPYFYGNKKRDLATGRIEKYELVNVPDINGKNILIIDDICVKGGTFILAAKALKEAGAKTVNLYVSHLENAVYDGDLLTTDWVDHIYTPNTMGIEIKSDKITETR